MKKHLIVSILILSLGLSACGSKKANLGENASDQGLMPEAFVPANVAVFGSYSFRNEDQFSALQDLEAKLGEGGEISNLISEQFDEQYGLDGLTFEEDILPALGENHRIFFASRGTSEDNETFAVVTLADPKKAEELLESFVEKEVLQKQKLSNQNAYLNTEKNTYLGIHKDLLFVANKPENFLEMTSMKESESLYANSNYEEVMEKVGANYLFFGAMIPSALKEDLNLPVGFGIEALSELVLHQSLVARVESDGISFEAYSVIDKEAAKESGNRLDIVPSEEPYLLTQIPAEGLMFYLESYGFAQSILQTKEISEGSEEIEMMKNINEAVTQYLAMDFETEILSFMGKGVVFAMHQNADEVIPAITLMFDVSADLENAETFVNKLDGQISGLQIIADQSVPGVFSRGTAEVFGETVSSINLDFSSLAEAGAGAGLIPQTLLENNIQIVFGIADNKLILSNVKNWDLSESLGSSQVYKELSAKLGDVNHGLAFVNTTEISDFINAMLTLRGELGLADSDIVEPLTEFLQKFKGGIAGSKAGAYEAQVKGYLLMN